MDEADQAQGIEQLERDSLICRHGRRKRRNPIARVRFCVSCGDEISEARQNVVPGTDHCTDCLRRLECKK